MSATTEDGGTTKTGPSGTKRMGRWIAVGLMLGVLCGIVFGEYCGALQIVGQAYVGLLQMTVVPYLVLSLISKTARLDMRQARRLGGAAVVVLLLFWLIGIILIVLVSGILPPVEGASFFSRVPSSAGPGENELLSQFIPANVFRSLSAEYVPAIVVFSLFFGTALIRVPGKGPFLDFLDLACEAIGRINLILVRLAPIGLFTLTAAAAGTLRIDELSRLQAYLVMFILACVAAAFGILPLLVSGLTTIRYRDFLRAAQEPLLIAVATGKLFVVLPQIAEKCEGLLKDEDETPTEIGESTASVLVPMAYPFPHVGKILAFVFISFAAWYVGRDLPPGETAAMATTGAVSSFASPLITVPYLLDEYQLPQDLMTLFILPGFITTRLADVVGVMHLMALTLIVTQVLNKRIRLRWRRLILGTFALLVCLGAAGSAGRWYLATTTLEYDLNKRLLSLEIPSPHDDVVVYRSRDDVPSRHRSEESTLDRVRSGKVLRVGYHADHLPYSFFNQQGELIGLDVELMHRLAKRLQVRLEFLPYTYDTLPDQLETREIDVAVGGLLMTPERVLRAGFTQPYETATVAIVVPDHRRGVIDHWDDPDLPDDLHLGVKYQDVAVAARRRLPDVNIEAVGSLAPYFESKRDDLDGIILSAEEGAVWSVLYPDYTVVVPEPAVQRPISMAVRSDDGDWLRFLDRWLDFERLDGSLSSLRRHWIEGGAVQERPPRWSVMRDVLHWVP